MVEGWGEIEILRPCAGMFEQIPGFRRDPLVGLVQEHLRRSDLMG
jgi:hypothetical protein